jgi:hypothetical protein
VVADEYRLRKLDKILMLQNGACLSKPIRFRDQPPPGANRTATESEVGEAMMQDRRVEESQNLGKC